LCIHSPRIKPPHVALGLTPGTPLRRWPACSHCATVGSAPSSLFVLYIALGTVALTHALRPPRVVAIACYELSTTVARHHDPLDARYAWFAARPGSPA